MRFPPSPLGVRVAGLAPGDTGVVSESRYTLVYIIYIRAKPRPTCVPPNCEAKGEPGASTRCRVFPKRKSRSIPSTARELGCSLSLRTKTEHCELISRLFEVSFSGIARVSCPTGPGIYFVFYFEHFCGYTFRTGQ
jgi:hypothetical protein